MTIATCSGCGVLLPDVMVVGTEQGIRAYNDGQSALIAQAKTTHKHGETPYWSNRRVQSGYSFWDRLSKGLVNTTEVSDAE
jgi:hypothetical protein